MRVFLLAAVLAAFCWALLRVPAVRSWLRQYRFGLGRGFRLSCWLLVGLLLVGGLAPVVTERMQFYEEATIVSTTAAFWHGQPIYVAPQAAAEYSLLYGPVTYLAYLPPLWAGAQRLEGYEGWSLLALLATFIVISAAFRPRFGTTVALGNAALAAAVVARVTGNVWAIKADVWILLFSALGLLAALRLRPTAGAALAALAGACLLDLKPTLLPVALLPLVALGQRGRGARLAAGVGGLMLLPIAALAFALPRVSFQNYLALLLEYRARATSPAMLKVNAEMTFLILLPTLSLFFVASGVAPVALRRWLRARWPFLLLLAAACAVATVTGAKVGGGPWHCTVLVFPCLLVNAEVWELCRGAGLTPRWAMPLGVGGALALTTLSAVAGGVRARLHDPPGEAAISMRAAESDLLALSQQHPGTTLQMGYTDQAHYNLTYVRPILQVRGNPLFVDGNARNEEDLAGRPISPAVLQALARCAIQLWVLPKDGEPFSLQAPYFQDPTVHRYGMRPELFPEEFRQTFLAHYQPLPTASPYYKLWACRAVASPQ